MQSTDIAQRRTEGKISLLPPHQPPQNQTSYLDLHNKEFREKGEGREDNLSCLVWGVLEVHRWERVNMLGFLNEMTETWLFFKRLEQRSESL